MLSDSFFCVEYYLFSFLWIRVCPRNINLFLCWKTEQLQLKKIFINERKKEIEQRRRSVNWEKIKWAKKKIKRSHWRNQKFLMIVVQEELNIGG